MLSVVGYLVGLEVKQDDTLKAAKISQWEAAAASAPKLVQSTAEAMAMFAASGGGSGKLKRKIAAAAILTMDRASKLTSSGLRAKGIRELESED